MTGGTGEFEIIERHFREGIRRDDVRVGIGDDGAVVTPPAGGDLVLVVDTIVEGVHFPADAPARGVGHRAMAVNLSDLAAMGAEPAWALLALTLPHADDAWLEGFAEGLRDLADEHGVALVGGDTTRGPLTASVQAAGFVDQVLRRDGARAGDRVWLSGDLGAAAGGLEVWQAATGARVGVDADVLTQRFLYPNPRVALGRALAGLAHAAIDVSDGLLADAGHIAAASGVRLRLETRRLPRAPALDRLFGHDQAVAFALRGGDDYELLFTAPGAADAAIRDAAARAGVPVTPIGDVSPGRGVAVDGEDAAGGYDHFRTGP